MNNISTTPKFTAIVLAKNESRLLKACLQCLGWCEEILLIDTGSTDKTAEIAESAGARVISFEHSSFARLREEALKHVKTDWLIYIDADERVTPQLAKEIMHAAASSEVTALALKRKNIFYGQTMLFGGWQNDILTRAFRRTALSGWSGEIHESPKFTGTAAQLTNPLIHLSHCSTQDGLIKSAHWTAIEAKLLYEAGVPKVGLATLLRKALGEFYRRVIINHGYRDGRVGLIESVIQAINRVLVYIQVWELQQKPGIKDIYSVKEREIELLWESDDKTTKT